MRRKKNTFSITVRRTKMVTYDVAQFHMENHCLIVVPVNASISDKSSREQTAFRAKIEKCAEQAGMNGIVVPVWRGYTGRMKFLAPPDLQGLLSRIEWSEVIKRINTKLHCA